MTDTERTDRDNLIDNVFESERQVFTIEMSTDTKEIAIKGSLNQMIKSLVVELNKEFDDVDFNSDWIAPFTMGNYGEQYDDDRSDDRDDYYTGDNDDLDDYHLYDNELSEIMLVLRYYWKRKCSLGCVHKTKRFRILTLPKLLELLAYRNLKQPIRKILEDFLPDFFYDPRPIQEIIPPPLPTMWGNSDVVGMNPIKRKRGRSKLARN